ncbi:adenylate/guanylate cyclase with Chase sensor [[Leptolyngbya] sp. PCC 7376]|uniref:CHASE2 domain-containing protein n=1 Tax=[Leptolyngbya] sp. PCC 7376 TaxID=111781 RepID=UPI00029F3D8D|nr:CHASE2 domain-containing protein [[Leptolyngbya] sp. PCC 7376]AFY39973.1 adenylate/guanylate cyclase with Chase sensor [[Leptolyngbya] sp. PCC 7376]
MSQLVILNLGSGDLENGFPGIVAEIWERENEPPVRLVGSLPPRPNLQRLYYRWKAIYQSLLDLSRKNLDYRIELEPDESPNNISISEFNTLNRTLPQQLNIWLNSKGFGQLERRLRARLNSQENIHFIIQAEDKVLRLLPWHLWNLFKDFPNAEVGLSLPDYERASVQRTKIGTVRILAIFGSDEGINLDVDRQILDKLPNAEVSILTEPDLKRLNEYLWDERGWDILFFAGHSNTNFDSMKGYLGLHPGYSLSIGQLINSFKKAIEQGLQMAIFNSCDGMGLATELARLNIPQTIVMREPVPDIVAHEFLKDFLTLFSNGLPLYRAVRQAREKLVGLKDSFPCADWLPVVCQNPTQPPATWLSLLRSMKAELTLPSNVLREEHTDSLVTLVFTDLENSTLLKSSLPGKDITEKNHIYYEKFLLPHRRYISEGISEYGGRVVETEGDGHFLVFGSAIKAAQWSIKLQEDYRLKPIHTPLDRLKVRIGIHTGKPIKDGSGYSGQEVDKAARILGFAHGEQILLSQMTSLLIQDSKVKDLDTFTHPPVFLKGIGNEVLTELLYLDKQPNIPRRPYDSLSNLLSIGVATLASIAVVAMRLTGLLQPLELNAYDQLMRIRPIENPDTRFVIIEITKDDVESQDLLDRQKGSLGDKSLDKLLRKINQAQPNIVGLDIYHELKVEEDYPYLAEQFRNNVNLIPVCQGTSGPNQSGINPPQEIPEGILVNRVGYSNFVYDGSDGKLRRALVASRFDTTNSSLCKVYFSFSYLIAYRYLVDKGFEFDFHEERGVLVSDEKIFSPMKLFSGGYYSFDNYGYQIPINFRSREDLKDITLDYLTLTEALDHPSLEEVIHDKIVLIGTTDLSFGDYHRTPFSKGFIGRDASTPGVVLHAHMASQLISAVIDDRPIIWWWNELYEVVWILSWGLISAYISIQSMPWLKQKLSILILSISLGLICYITLLYGGWLPFVPALLSIILASSLVSRRQKILENFTKIKNIKLI